MAMAAQAVIIATLMLGSMVWVELVRDSYHVLAHVWPRLYRLHHWHHRVFRPDLTPVSEAIYRQAHWYNDVPEALVMLLFSFLPLAIALAYHWPYAPLAGVGLLYTLVFLGAAVLRGSGFPGMEELTDLTHRPGEFRELPGDWWVNRTYHWRHHFDNPNAYFCGTMTLVDKVLGTALSLKGKKIAVTGATGTLGRALLAELHGQGAKVTALSSSVPTVTLSLNGQEQVLPTRLWQVGQEADLAAFLEDIEILVLNHGINPHGDRSPAAIELAYEVNAWSSWRLLELFLGTVRTNRDKACKEVWFNTSEAEVSPAFSPLYELSKRTLGDLIALRRLDAPCVMRKLILGPFRSQLNPAGVMSANWVAKLIVALAKRDFRNIIVTINPLTYLLFPLKELAVSLYFRLFTGKAKVLAPPPSVKP